MKTWFQNRRMKHKKVIRKENGTTAANDDDFEDASDGEPEVAF